MVLEELCWSVTKEVHLCQTLIHKDEIFAFKCAVRETHLVGEDFD